MKKASPSVRVLIVSSLMLLALLLRLRGLGDESLWLDEGISAHMAGLSWSELLRVFAEQRANMALYLVVLKLWPFTATEAGLRMLSVVFAVLTVPAIESLGRRLFSPAAGLLAAAVLALHGFHLQYSQEARAYTLLVLLLVLAMRELEAMAEPGAPRRHSLLYALLMAAAAYAQFMAVFALAAHALSFATGAAPEARRRVLRSCAAAAVAILPLALLMAQKDLYRIAWVPPISIRQVLTGLVSVAGYLGLPEVLIAMALGLTAFLAVARKGAPAPARRMAIWLVLPLLLPLALSLVKPMFVARYLFVAVPPLVLLLAWAAADLVPRRFRAAAAVALLLSMACGTPRSAAQGKEDWRGATLVVTANARPADGLVFFDAIAYRCYEFYSARQTRGLPRLVFPDTRTFWNATAAPQPRHILPAASHERIWVLRRSPGLIPRASARALEATLARTHQRERVWQFHRTAVELWVRAAVID